MTTEQPERPRLLRSRRDRVLGGVCAGIAEHLGVDALMIRLAAVALGIFSGGTAVLAYLIAWILIPKAAESAQRPEDRLPLPAGEGGAREAWNAVGGQVKALAADFRSARPTPMADPAAETSQRPRNPVDAVDSAVTSLGQRLRDPQVQAGARQAASSLSTAISASVDQLGRRGRRDEPPVPGTAASPAGADEGLPSPPPADPEPEPRPAD
jgi:phage shock protein PspC (stress-responsive transcriptional regulator)